MTLRKFQTSADDTLDSGLYFTRLFCPPSAPSNTGSTCKTRHQFSGSMSSVSATTAAWVGPCGVDPKAQSCLVTWGVDQLLDYAPFHHRYSSASRQKMVT